MILKKPVTMNTIFLEDRIKQCINLNRKHFTLKCSHCICVDPIPDPLNSLVC